MKRKDPTTSDSWRIALTSLLVLTAGLVTAIATTLPGDLDPLFDGDGKVTTDLGGRDQAEALVLQPDGKLVVAGRSGPFGVAPSDVALARYNPDGTLDASFGSGGVVISDLGGSEFVPALVLQPDGKLVIAGRSDAAGTGDIALARYQTNGSLDASFGSGGVVTTDLGGNDLAFALVLQPDGKLVAAGRSDRGGTPDIVLARYQVDGTLDASFSSSGVVTTDLGLEEEARALVLQPDGKLVVAGRTGTGGGVDADFDLVLARYTPGGLLDASFGTGGWVTTDIGRVDVSEALTIQPDDKLVVLGGTPSGVVVLARYNSDGSLDGSFGTGGVVHTDFGGSQDTGHALVLQPDGKLVVGGTSFAFDVDNDFALARYEPDGSRDATFGTGGVVGTDLGGKQDHVTAFVLQPDGKLVAAGGTGFPSIDFALARYVTGLEDSDGDGIPDVADPDTAATFVDTLPDESFGAPGHRRALLSRLAAVERRIAAGDTAGAIRQLEDLLRRLDGCDGSPGEMPDADDWVVNCDEQRALRDLILRMIASLRS